VLAAALLVAAPVSGQSVERSVYAGVVDRAGAPVTGLTDRDFVVRENDIAREVLRVLPASDPMQIAVLVDTSSEAERSLSDIRSGLKAFFAEMGDRHQIALVGFGARPSVLVDYTSDPARLAAGADRMFTESNSGSYLLDALIEVPRGLERREGERRTIVVVTLQGPEFSERYHQYVVEDLERRRVTLHAYIIGSPTDLSSDQARERSLTLDLGARATGGRQQDLLTSSTLPAKMRELAAELKNQYRVVYARPDALIPPDRIEVSVRRPELVVHAMRTLPQP
jgi:VWFA-related protein